MIDQARPVQIASMEEVQARFTAWRSNPGRGRRIPEDLWDAAVSLCTGRSVCKVSRALGLDYKALRSRFLRSKAVEPKGAFVELPPLWSQGDVLIECDGGRDRQLRIHCKGPVDPRLVDLIHGFFESRR